MEANAKKPRLTLKEIANQIFIRTGFPKAVIKTIMDEYAEITEEALLGQVEVPFGRIGYFSWKQINPRENVVTYDAYNHCYREPQDVPGFQKTVFKTNRTWAGRIKEATLFGLDEENPAITSLINYDEDEDVDDGD